MSEDVAIEVAQKKFVPFLERNQKVIYDSHVITASYLIRNIDHAFGMWEKQPWGKYIKFEDFCEYILPYRVAFEPLSERLMPRRQSRYWILCLSEVTYYKRTS